jgi:ATP-dependent helicase/nuclease subunit A
VSELKKAAYEEADGIPMFAPEEEAAYVPIFVREQEEESHGTQRGSAYHRVLELLPYGKLSGRDLSEDERKDFITTVMSENVANGKLSEEYAGLVFLQRIAIFLKSDLARRMAEADVKGRLYKEKPFFLGVPAKELRDSFPEEEMILVQGVIDVYFEEEDGITLADYKTDRVDTEEELIRRYKAQLDIYARALEQITGKTVKEKRIYSLTLNKEINV